MYLLGEFDSVSVFPTVSHTIFDYRNATWCLNLAKHMKCQEMDCNIPYFARWFFSCYLSLLPMRSRLLLLSIFAHFALFDSTHDCVALFARHTVNSWKLAKQIFPAHDNCVFIAAHNFSRHNHSNRKIEFSWIERSCRLLRNSVLLGEKPIIR